MNKYVVAYVGLYDYDLEQTVIAANSAKEAMLKFILELRVYTDQEIEQIEALETEETIQEFCENSANSLISAIRVY